MYIIMLGAPGSGKGTIGKILSRDLQLKHVSTGDIFREHIANKTEFGKQIEYYMENGILVPDDKAIEVIETRLLENDVKNGAILDGFPRTVIQAGALKEFLAKNNLSENVIAIELNVTDSEIIKRILNRINCSNKKCKAIYNLDTRPSKVEGVCDICGSKLEKRTDDNKETITRRLKIYHQSSKDVIKFYKQNNALYSIHPENSDKAVEDIKEFIKNRRK